MRKTNISGDEVLNLGVKLGILNKLGVQTQLIDMIKKEVLANHNYKINQGSDGYWKTYVYDETKPKNRRLVKKISKDDLIDYLCSYYKDRDESDKFTLWDCFEEQAKKETAAGIIRYASEKKYLKTLERYFSEKGEFNEYKWFGEIPFRKITTKDLDSVFKKIISDSKIIPSAFRDLRTAVVRVFKYAKDNNYTNIEIERYFDELYVPKKAFTKNKVDKNPIEETFMKQEIEALVTYWRAHPTLKRLGLILAAETGVRIGELSACMKEDVSKDRKSIYIHRTQTSGPKRADGRYSIVIADSTKTPNGKRIVALVPKAQETVREILKFNPNGTYLFETKNGNWIRTTTFNEELKASCAKLGIEERSAQKIRRMFITEAYNSPLVNETTLITSVGQGTIEVARKKYLVDSQPIDVKIAQLSNVVDY